MKKIKRIKVNLGTDIIVSTPTHPLSVAMQIRRVIDRILSLDDTEYEYSCNSLEGLAMFEYYGAQNHPKEISVVYFVNGAKVSYEKAKSDLERGRQFIEELLKIKI